ncbi:MAG TPA: DUF3137 domain-containing protein [Parvularculaceae bacterium]|nr:DUF3137 domain-containing protein [Parvularculaceae bacterium]
MQLKPPSDRPIFSGFDAFYETSIAPYLAEKERDRVAAVTNILILGAATTALTLALAFFGPLGDSNVEAAFFVGAGGAALCGWLLNRTRADITHGLLDRVASRLGFAYRGRLARPFYHERFRSLRMLPNHNREAWEDEVRGEHAGAEFTLCEAHLKYKTSGKNSSTRTVFHGQLFVIDYPKRFLGTTVVLRDSGVLNRFGKPGKEFHRVGLVSTDFEKAFEAWSTDQVEARELLDPLILERFLELERLYEGKKIRAAFDDGKLLIAIETGDRLNMGTMFRPLTGTGRVETILAEFDVIFDLIEVLLKRLDGRIDGAFSLDHVKRA